MLEHFHVPPEDEVRIMPDALRFTVNELFLKMGLSERDAWQATDVLLLSDTRGVDTHGVSNMLRNYMESFAAGFINPNPNWTITRETATTANVDCDRGLGITVIPQVMELAIEKAATTGIASVAVNNSSHYGAAGYYARQALDHDMIGFSMSSGGMNVIIPLNGRWPWMGTNPMAFAAPADREPAFVIDMASSISSFGKLAIAESFGVDIPVGWAQDANGNTVTDITRRNEVIGQPPLGGTHEQGAHKGMGIGMMADVLSAILPNEPVSGLVPDEAKGGGRFCHYFQATRIDGFRPAAEFKADMDVMLRTLREQESAPGAPDIQYPGNPDAEYVKKRTETGIPLPRHTVNYFKQMADQLNVAWTIGG